MVGARNRLVRELCRHGDRAQRACGLVATNKEPALGQKPQASITEGCGNLLPRFAKHENPGAVSFEGCVQQVGGDLAASRERQKIAFTNLAQQSAELIGTGRLDAMTTRPRTILEAKPVCVV